MNSSEIRQVLEDTEVLPSRALGQNFLCDANIAQWIVEQLDIQPEDCIVEVGPGTGALTEYIIGKGRKTILIEFDSRLAAFHKEQFAHNPHVEVHHADAAQWDIRSLFKEAPVKFLGNLPYSAGGAILSNFLGRPSPINKAVVMLQKEFIDRILASPDDDAYGLLSLRMQANWIPRALKTVPPEAFHPRPRIDSTIMLLEQRPVDSMPPYDYRLLDELMRRAFSQRRKQMKRQLPPTPAWETVASALNIPLTARAEELNLHQWVDLTRLYDTHPLADTAQSDTELLDIVDKTNTVIGQGTRTDIHRKEEKHRAIHIFTFTKNGDIILQKRSHLKDRHPSVWDSSASGHVEHGESYEHAAQRELNEELGITNCPTELVGTLPPTKANGEEFVELHYATLPAKLAKLHFPAAEIEAVQSFPLIDVEAWIARRPEDFSSGFLECFTLWKKARKPTPA